MEVIPRNKSLLPINNSPALVWCPHPLAAAGRQVFRAAFLPGESISAYLDRVGLDLARRPVALYLNDDAVQCDAWSLTFPKLDDIITVRAVVHGGGGDGNKVLRTMLTIAVMVAAPAYGATLGASLGASAAVGTAMISIGGMMVVNAILPPPSPDLGNAQGGNESPTYSLNGGANRARLMQPMPLVIGSHRIVPDLGAREYTEFEGKDQYLYAVYNYGLSDMVLSDHRIGDTPLANFADIETEQVVGGNIDLFPANVDTLNVGVSLDSTPELMTNSDFNNENNLVFGAGWTYGSFTRDVVHEGSDGVLSISNVSVITNNEYYAEYLIKTYGQGSVTASLESQSADPQSGQGIKRQVIFIPAGGGA